MGGNYPTKKLDGLFRRKLKNNQVWKNKPNPSKNPTRKPKTHQDYSGKMGKRNRSEIQKNRGEKSSVEKPTR